MHNVAGKMYSYIPVISSPDMDVALMYEARWGTWEGGLFRIKFVNGPRRGSSEFRAVRCMTDVLFVIG